MVRESPGKAAVAQSHHQPRESLEHSRQKDSGREGPTLFAFCLFFSLCFSSYFSVFAFFCSIMITFVDYSFS